MLQPFQKLILVLIFQGIVACSRKGLFVFFFSLLVLGQREARCWSVCKGFVIVCHEQCGRFRQDNDTRQQEP